jgi:hypothetical protein
MASRIEGSVDIVNPADIRRLIPFLPAGLPACPSTGVEPRYRNLDSAFYIYRWRSDKPLGRAVITKLWRCSSKRAVRQVFYLRVRGESLPNGRLGIFAVKLVYSGEGFGLSVPFKLQARIAPTIPIAIK